MNTQQFIGYMHSPAQLGKEAGAQLDSLTREFPYFQTAQLLYVKSLHNENSFLYNNQLKLAAAYAADRRVLYELITSKQALADEAKTQPETKTDIQPSASSTQEKQEQKQEPVAEEKTEAPQEKAQPALTAEQILKARLAELAQEWDEGVLRQLQLLRHWQKDSGLTNPFEERKNPFRQEEEKSSSSSSDKKEEALPEEKKEEKTEISTEPASAETEMTQILTVLIEPDEEDVTVSETETPVQENPAAEETEESLEYEITPLSTPEEPVAKPEDPVDQEILFKAIGSSIELEVSDELPSLEELQAKQKEETAQEQQAQTEREERTERSASSEENALSFAQWLKSLNREAQELPHQEEIKAKEQPGQEDIIERFIQSEPRITPQKAAFYNPVNMARKSVTEDSELVTETLARIYEKQGNIPKAIRAYQKLSLKYPEKSLYFASLIENLKKTPNKNSK